MDDWTPDPQPFGSLEPPRKHPPTAVGVATPPPPGRPYRRTSRRRNRRKASVMFAITLVAAGAGVLAGVELSVAALMRIGAWLSAAELASLVIRSNPKLRRP